MSRTSRKQQNLPVLHSISESACLYDVGLYARLSSEDNGKDSDSIESQIELMEKYIAENPTMKKAAAFIDNGYTGTNFERPGFQQMIEAAQAGTINCIVVKDLSRLGRNYLETGSFLERIFPFLGVRVIAVNDNYDSASLSSNSELAASLSNIINDFYAKDISRKVFSALAVKMANGEYIGAWEKYGYLKDPANKNRLIVNPETAPVVQQIFQWRSTGMSYMGINKRLNEMGVLSPGQYKAERGIVTNNNQKPRKILWNKHIITDILKDITYIGHMAQRKTTQNLCSGVPFTRVDERDWVIAYHTHEPIISQELFDKVQEINRSSAATAKSNYGKYDYLPKARNIYGAKLVCADCGARMKLQRSINQKKDKAYFTFICPTYAEHGQTGCSKKCMRKADLDDAVFQAIRAQMDTFLEYATVIKKLLAKKQAVKSNTSQKQTKASLSVKVRNLRSQISNLYIDFKDGLLNDEEYLMQKERYSEKLVEAERALSTFVENESETEEQLVGIKRWAAISKEYANASELSEGLLTACVKQIKFHSDDYLEIEFNYMQEFSELLETAARLRKDVA